MKRAILLIVGMLVISGACFAQDNQALSVEDNIKMGDEYYDKFDNKQALDAYKKAYQADTSNCEALWKLSRSYVDIGEQSGEDVQAQYYYMGERFGRRAVRHCTNNAEAYFNLAVAVGRVALKVGGKTKVKMSAEVKTLTEKAIELDPEHDGAQHLLGRWHREVANLSGLLKAFAKILYGGLPPASNEDAVKYLKNAIEIKPEHINHHLELARTYEKMKEWQLAKVEYEKVLELPISDADDSMHKKDAEEELKNINKKLN